MKEKILSGVIHREENFFAFSVWNVAICSQCIKLYHWQFPEFNTFNLGMCWKTQEDASLQKIYDYKGFLGFVL